MKFSSYKRNYFLMKLPFVHRSVLCGQWCKKIPFNEHKGNWIHPGIKPAEAAQCVAR